METTTQAIAQLIQGELFQAEPLQIIQQLKPLNTANPEDLSFYEPSQKNITEDDLKQSKAGVVITSEAFKDFCPNGCIVVEKPKACFAQVAALFEEVFVPKSGIHPSAVIGENCKIDNTARIAAGVVIGDGAQICADVSIGANTVIGERVVIEAKSLLFANVTIYPKVRIGQRVRIDSGTIIGADGFGYVPDDKGVWQRLPQLGSVVIHNDVSIGAACTIDCGALSDTVIHDGVKIDDQVHIAHNAVIGAHTVIAGCSAISGSVTIGKHCMLAGAVRTADNLSIADQVVLTAGSGVSKSIKEPGIYGCSIPVAPMAKWRRILGRLYHLDDLAKRIIRLEKKVND
jgi:UDP-3-O-[3-hydroxymyristoyl] glucosamine N-acyltransferase